MGDYRQVSFVAGGVRVGVTPPCGYDTDGVGIEAVEGFGAESPVDEGGLRAVAMDAGSADVGGGLVEGWRPLNGVGGVRGALEEADCEVLVGVGGRCRVGEIGGGGGGGGGGTGRGGDGVEVCDDEKDGADEGSERRHFR